VGCMNSGTPAILAIPAEPRVQGVEWHVRVGIRLASASYAVAELLLTSFH